MKTGPAALITGIFGQDGALLAELLLSKGYRVIGAHHSSVETGSFRLQMLGIDHRVELIECDVAKDGAVAELLKTYKIDEFYNLAAQSFVGQSWDRPEVTTSVNALAVLYILEALRNLSPETRFFQASSAEMFGNGSSKLKTEGTALNPCSPYAVAKAYGHHMTVNYRASHGLHASSGILFNHDSRLRSREFVTRKITYGLAQIAVGFAGPLELGNIACRRDWGFAGEYVEAMWQMLQQPQPDDYVIATGKAHSIRDFVEATARVFDMEIEWCGSGLDEVGRDRATGRAVVVINDKFFRPAEVDILVGDASKAQAALGWASSTDLDMLVADMAMSDYNLLVKKAS